MHDPFKVARAFPERDHGCQSVKGGILSYLEGKLLTGVSREHPTQVKSIFCTAEDNFRMNALIRAADDGKPIIHLPERTVRMNIRQLSYHY